MGQMELATKFLDTCEDLYKGCIELAFITRDKGYPYFEDIFNGDGIMKKYIKDGHANPQQPYGSPQNPINGGLEGLFFSAIVDWSTGKPYPTSVYGNRRLTLPVDQLLTTDKNLYFSDFYCMRSGTGNRHTVTLVLCDAGSISDVFCASQLVLLDMGNNSFLQKTNGTFWVSKGAYVEIFYTEDLDISNYQNCMSYVESTSTGRNPSPVKNTICRYCNQPSNPDQSHRLASAVRKLNLN